MTTIQAVGPGPIVGEQIQNKVPVTRKLSAVLSILSAITACAGFTSDFWLVHDTDSDTQLHSGLFKTCWGPFCVSYVDVLIKEPAWIVEVLAGVAGIGLMSLSTILKMYTIYSLRTQKSVVGLDTFFNAFGTICMVVLLGTFISLTTGFTGSYGWSMYLFCVGIGLGFMSAVLTCMYYTSMRA